MYDLAVEPRYRLQDGVVDTSHRVIAKSRMALERINSFKRPSVSSSRDMVKRPHEARMLELERKFPAVDDTHDPLLRAAAERRLEMDIASKKKLSDLAQRISALSAGTWKSASGLRMALELRRFWAEACGRLGRFGPESMPSSFNVLEAFIQADAELLTFRLRDEREHLLSFEAYLDWYTRGAFPEVPGCLVDVMPEGIIHSYDFIVSAEEPLLSASDSTLLVAGTSLVRHKDELSILLLAGVSPPLEGSDAQGRPMRGKELLTPAEGLGANDRFLEGTTGFSRILLASRLDLSRRSYDVRYLLLDQGASYLIATDDTAPIRYAFERTGIKDGLEEILRLQSERLEEYGDLFSAAAALVYLPIFFVGEASLISDSEFLTELGENRRSREQERIDRLVGPGVAHRSRRVRCLPKSGSKLPLGGAEAFLVRPPALHFETEGFWRPLNPGEIGNSADGSPVIGKTWVERTETWEASSPAEFLASRAKTRREAGEAIYVVRSPGHASDVYKIGMTRRGVESRAHELSSSTATPLPFGVIASWQVQDAGRIEQEVHRALASFRISARREFFRAPLSTIIRAVEEVIQSEEAVART